MKSEETTLNSVNWEFGMLLTPNHFLLQERYFEASLLWLLRYATDSTGLVGGGPRVPESELGAAKYDPVVSIDEDATSLSISVSQCRALTAGGCIIEIGSDRRVQRRFERSELEGVAEAGIYIQCNPFEREAKDGGIDEFNPQMKTERQPTYRLSLNVSPQDTPYAICVGRLRRQRNGARFEKDREYIPACTAMCSHSELAAGWRRVVEAATLLADRCTELYRATREFLVLFAERGIDTEADRETAEFMERMVVLLQDSVYDLLDPNQSPRQFFGKLRSTFHKAAVYLDLTPSVQLYFETLRDSGETGLVPVLNQQHRILVASPTWSLHDDLRVEVRSALATLAGLQQLERAVEGKYLDFRVSPSLEALNFIFDRGGRVLYKVAAKPSRVQGGADEFGIYFAQLRLEGREKYRLILIGEPDATFEKGTRIPIEIRINEGTGFRRVPIRMSCESRGSDQRNFEYDFEAPDVPTITDIHVSLQAHHPVRTAVLFARHRFYAYRAEDNVRPVEPLQPSGRGVGGYPEPSVLRDMGMRPKRRLEPIDNSQADAPAEPRGAVDRPSPWERPRRNDEHAQNDEPPPPRRRRLE